MRSARPEICYLVRPIETQHFLSLAPQGHEKGRVIERDGLALFGFGTVAVLELASGLSEASALEDTVADLGAIACLDANPEAGSPVPLAMGALGFDRRARGELYVPELTLIATPGTLPTALLIGSRQRIEEMLAKLAGDGFSPEVPRPLSSEATSPPDEFRLASARTHQDFLSRINAALLEIEAGRLDKLVLAREVYGRGQPALAPRRSAGPLEGTASFLHGVCDRRLHRCHT